MSDPIRIGIIGMGFMGQTHLRAYRSAFQAGEPCRLVAVCDTDDTRQGLPNREVEGNITRAVPSPPAELPHDPPGFVADDLREYPNPGELIRDANVDLVSICTPTESHAPLSVEALQAGKHVLVEKPLAITAHAIEPVIEAVRRAAERGRHGPILMPAFCMRFWPGWTWLIDAIESGRYGRVVSARFTRLGAPPTWSPDFYRDPKRTGGALVDLHIHDVDFILRLFGPPDSIVSTGSLDHITTLYRYTASGRRGPFHVAAEGGWDHSPGFAFRMQYVVIFDEATAEYDSRASSCPLVLTRNGRSEPVDIEPLSGYDGEVRHILRLIRARRGDGPRDLTQGATVEDAHTAAHLIDLERHSLETLQPMYWT